MIFFGNSKAKKLRKRNGYILATIIIVAIAIFTIGSCITGFCISNELAPAVPLDVIDEGDSGVVLSAEATLGKCLTEKGATMYGAYWCGHCNNQKDMFGDDFQYVDYVECTEDAAACTSAGVRGYPTWVINGQLYPGEKPLANLAQLAGCEY